MGKKAAYVIGVVFDLLLGGGLILFILIKTFFRV